MTREPLRNSCGRKHGAQRPTHRALSCMGLMRVCLQLLDKEFAMTKAELLAVNTALRYALDRVATELLDDLGLEDQSGLNNNELEQENVELAQLLAKLADANVDTCEQVDDDGEEDA